MPEARVRTEERRRAPRIKVQHLQVHYREGRFHLFPAGFDGRGMILDLSIGGLRLVTNRVLKTAGYVALRLKGATEKEIPLAGWITRCRQIRDNLPGSKGHLYETGIRLAPPAAAYLSMVGRFRRDPLLCQGF